MFHQALSTGMILVADDDNPIPKWLVHPASNNREVKGRQICSKPTDDIDRVIEAARPSGNTIR
jgi:hypothetical protein